MADQVTIEAPAGQVGTGVVPSLPLEIPGGTTFDFSPQSVHLRLGALHHPLHAGDVFHGTLAFERGGTLAVDFLVETGKAPE